MKKETKLVLPKKGDLTIADMAKRFVFSTSTAAFRRNYGTFIYDTEPEVKGAIEKHLRPIQHGKPLANPNILEEMLFAAADDDMRQALHGVCVELETQQLITTDGRRLLFWRNPGHEVFEVVEKAYKRLVLDRREKEEEQPVVEKSVIVKKFNLKSKAAQLIMQSADSPQEWLDENAFEYKGVYYQFIEMSYPNWRTVVPKSFHYDANGLWGKMGHVYAYTKFVTSVTDDFERLGWLSYKERGWDFGVSFNPYYIADFGKFCDRLGLTPSFHFNDDKSPFLGIAELPGSEEGIVGYILMPARGEKENAVSLDKMTAKPWVGDTYECSYLGTKLPPCIVPDDPTPVVDTAAITERLRREREAEEKRVQKEKEMREEMLKRQKEQKQGATAISA